VVYEARDVAKVSRVDDLAIVGAHHVSAGGGLVHFLALTPQLGVLIKHFAYVLHYESPLFNRLSRAKAPALVGGLNRIYISVLVKLKSPVFAAVSYRTNLGQAVLVNGVVEALLAAVDGGAGHFGQVRNWLAGAEEGLVVVGVQHGLVALKVAVFLDGAEHGEAVGQHAPALGVVLDVLFLELEAALFVEMVVVLKLVVLCTVRLSLP
jgi:hypothetical protein